MSQSLSYKPTTTDFVLKWSAYLSIFGLMAIVGACALQLREIQYANLQRAKTVQIAANVELNTQIARLQEENMRLRASLIETQQRLASGASKKAALPQLIATPKKIEKPIKIAVKAKKKPRIIQVSFDDSPKRYPKQ